MSNLPDLDALLNGDDDFDGDLVKNLRNALKAQKQELKQAAEELTRFRKTERTRSLADVLKDKGVPTKAAKYFPADVEPTTENIDKWLAEDGDLFGIETPQTAATDEQRMAAERISAVSAGAPPVGGGGDVQDLVAAIAAAKTQAELDAAYERAGLTQSGD
jgi:hypothetical protein